MKGAAQIGQRAVPFFSAALVFIALAAAIAIVSQSSLVWWQAALIGMNGATFLLCGYDKGIAGGTATRVPEAVFFLGALLGGGPGLALAMMIIRHKTRKPGFQFAIALICLVQILLLGLLLQGR